MASKIRDDGGHWLVMASLWDFLGARGGVVGKN